MTLDRAAPEIDRAPAGSRRPRIDGSSGHAFRPCIRYGCHVKRAEAAVKAPEFMRLAEETAIRRASGVPRNLAVAIKIRDDSRRRLAQRSQRAAGRHHDN
jgi:hypothetical protein